MEDNLESEKNRIFHEFFINPIEKTGRYTLLAAFFSLFIPGLYLYFFHGILPATGPLFRSLLSVWSFMVVLGIIEPMVYYPLLGFGGTYLSFLSGNIINLRVPVATTTLQITETKTGSPEAEILATIAIAGSILTTTIIIIVCAIALLPFLQALTGSGTALEVSFNNVLPALFGSLTAFFVLKTPKIALFPLGLGIAIAFFKSDLPYAVVIPPLVLVSVLFSRFLYKRGLLKNVSND